MKYDVKYSKGYLIGLFCITVFLIAGTIFITYNSISIGRISSALLQDAKDPNWFYVVMSVILSIMDIVTIFGFISRLKFKLTVEDNKITVRKTFSTKEYNIKELDSVYQSSLSSRYNINNESEYTLFFKSPEKLNHFSFNEKMLNWTLLADKLVELGEIKKENGKYKDLY